MNVSIRNLGSLAGATFDSVFAILVKTAGLVIPAAMVLIAAGAAPAAAESRIKDIVNVEGVRDNLLVGYGLSAPCFAIGVVAEFGQQLDAGFHRPDGADHVMAQA